MDQRETLSETAGRAGISPQYLSEVERGRKEPSSEMIAALAGALGNPAQLAAGISEALTTTALGIGLAIPFLAFFHYFRNKTRNFEIELEDEVADLVESTDERLPRTRPQVTPEPDRLIEVGAAHVEPVAHAEIAELDLVPAQSDAGDHPTPGQRVDRLSAGRHADPVGT